MRAVYLFLFGLLGCGQAATPRPFQVVASGQPEALFGVSGSGADDVWLVGADRGRGPIVLHYDGAVITRHDTGHRGDLWWVHVGEDGAVLMAGEGGALLRFDGKNFARLPTPGLGRQTSFGLWHGRDETWAVGGAAGRDGYAWRGPAEGLAAAPLPLLLPRRGDGEIPALLKVWGDGQGTVWAVGDRGTVLRTTGRGEPELVPLSMSERLFTVHGHGAEVVVVGGTGQGFIGESGSGFVQRAPEATPLLQGVWVGPETAYAVGQQGAVLRRSDGVWGALDTSTNLAIESLHAVWGDPEGGVWAVGGNVLSTRLDGGAAIYAGQRSVPALAPPSDPPPPQLRCPETDVDPAEGASAARRWNEQALSAIRRDLPRPTVHARNLFHLSAALFDAWAAYDNTEKGYLVRERHMTADSATARREAVSYAGYRLLLSRYRGAIGGEISAACMRALMVKMGYDPDDDHRLGDDPRALGNRIAATYLSHFAEDGANEKGNYQDPGGYTAQNAPLIVDLPGARAKVPSRWQPLNLSVAATQNGIVLEAGTQRYIGSQWGQVTPFALTRPSPDAPYLDPGPPPGADLVALRPQVTEILRLSSQLGPEAVGEIDVSPGAIGNNPLGSNDGRGHAQNPVTGQPYPPNRVSTFDFGRVLAEHWADGPQSETPPGHWNVLLNRVSEHPLFKRRLFGAGAELDALAWDVHAYFALNGALHDAAIVAWEVKRRFDSSRPITLVRHMAERGQCSEMAARDFSEEGLPLLPGLIERITEHSAASGARHAHLRHFLGELAVLSWRGEPGDRKNGVGGVAWVRALDWLPYQRRTFVTPAFPGFVSGHSTFSRAAAEVLAALTGSAFFPGGFAEYTAEKDRYLQFERGPQQTVRLQWATYFDAADQAGQSRLWGGIHISSDDFAGRRLGRSVGLLAIAKARGHYDGSVR